MNSRPLPQVQTIQPTNTRQAAVGTDVRAIGRSIPTPVIRSTDRLRTSTRATPTNQQTNHTRQSGIGSTIRQFFRAEERMQRENLIAKQDVMVQTMDNIVMLSTQKNNILRDIIKEVKAKKGL